jgi:hypothetical protein
MFENKAINGIFASRFIMSWIRSGGTFNRNGGYSIFSKWLKSLNLSDEDVNYIVNLAENGKLELEESAKAFIQTN